MTPKTQLSLIPIQTSQNDTITLLRSRLIVYFIKANKPVEINKTQLSKLLGCEPKELREILPKLKFQDNVKISKGGDSLLITHKIEITELDNLPTEEKEQILFDFWVETFGLKKHTFKQVRRQKAKARLKTCSVQQLKWAIIGISQDKWHVKNKKYELEYIFRNDENVEKFSAMAKVDRLYKSPENEPIQPESKEKTYQLIVYREKGKAFRTGYRLVGDFSEEYIDEKLEEIIDVNVDCNQWDRKLCEKQIKTKENGKWTNQTLKIWQKPKLNMKSKSNG